MDMWPHFLLTLENIFPMLYQTTYLDVICFFKHMTLMNILETIHDIFVTILQSFLQVANNFVFNMQTIFKNLWMIRDH
jgi:hypothetical protein